MDETTRRIKSHRILADANAYSEWTAVDDARPKCANKNGRRKNRQNAAGSKQQLGDKISWNKAHHDQGR